MKYWEIIAHNLSKAGWSWVVSQRLIPTGERSGLQTHIATTESVSLCGQMKADRVSGARIGDSRWRRIGLTS
jgi:hypothetical protein